MRYFLLLFLACTLTLSAQNVLFNEVMSSNFTIIPDENGDYSDWIELYNNNNFAVDLNGYGITDDSTDLFKWVMPSQQIGPYKHLFLFASGKNRSIVHWETIINWGAWWKYFPGYSEPPAQWKDPGFNDASWQSGKSGFGYGDGDDSTVVPQLQSLYIRKIFVIDSLNTVEAMLLHADYDDGFVAYLNGVEIARANIGTAGIPPAYNESANSSSEAVIYQGGRPPVFYINNFKSLLRQGTNIIAIQVHNYGTGSSDMTMIPFLTIGLNKVPENPNGTHPLLDIPHNYLHTNFQISAGEKILLTGPQGTVNDRLVIPDLNRDISLGRKPDGGSNWFYFSQPTPGDTNNTYGFQGYAGEPVFSVQGGLFTSGVSLTITPSSISNIIRYTVDGSEPTSSSPQYTSPLSIVNSKVVKAKEFNQNLIPGKTVTNTYLINFSTQLPVISISTDPGNFFNVDYGIYVMGDSADPNSPYFGANFWQDWERPIHIEFFDNNGGRFNTDAGVRIFGGWTRSFDQKSLAIYMRDIYGNNVLNYKLFPDLPYTEYESFVLRNSGNDWQYTLLRDALSTSLVTPVDIDKQAYRPVVVFINGQYWGIQDLREKVNEHFLAAHHDVDPDSIDLLQDFAKVLNGSSTGYMTMYNFIASNSMTIPANYEYVKTQIDVDNFINYYAAQITIGNRDWPGANIKYWRKQNTGKWRWIMFDTDFGFGIYETQGYTHNTLEFATQTNGPEWPNPDWSTLMLRKLLENISFRNDFINRFADFSNSIFKAQTVVNKIAQLKSAIEPEIPRHSARWNQFNLTSWNNNIQYLYAFANNRLGFVRTHFQDKFSLPGTRNVNLFINDTAKGSIKLNSLNLTVPSWSGIYFMSIPVRIIAQPKRGFKFAGWQGSSTSTEDTLVVNLSDNLTLQAVFQVDEQFTEPKIVVNEINYNSSASFNPEDWVEFYNNSDTTVNISGWKFMDEDPTHSYSFPEGTIIGGRQYIVLCRDTVLFRQFFQYPPKLYGNFSFGLSGSGELIRLYDKSGYLVDSLTYRDTAPWPSEPDGNGPTLSLKNPDLDNSNPLSWGASPGFGSPGRINDNYTQAEDIDNTLPAEYSLYQNYPNPFNPSTRIKFSVPETGIVTIKIYDVLGAEIRELVNHEFNPGTYEIEFEASGLSSGIYFCKMNCQKFSQVKKIQLLK